MSHPMIETITIYFSPLPSTKIATVIGLDLAYHMALVYTNAAGESFGASSGPSDQSTRQTPASALTSLVASARNAPSDFGTLLSDPKNNHLFIIGRPEDYYTQDYEGTPYPHAMAMSGRDLSAQWHSILDTYTIVGKMRLTYSPISQNSNSMAGTALRKAGIPIPFSAQTKFAPALFTILPLKPDELDSVPTP